MPLINCEINLTKNWSGNYFILVDLVDDEVPAFDLIYMELDIPVVALLSQDNVKLLQQLKSVFKRTINWSKYL